MYIKDTQKCFVVVTISSLHKCRSCQINNEQEFQKVCIFNIKTFSRFDFFIYKNKWFWPKVTVTELLLIIIIIIYMPICKQILNVPQNQID